VQGNAGEHPEICWRPVRLNTIAASLSEGEGAIEEVREPCLMQFGLLDRSREAVSLPRSRTSTSAWPNPALF
jgi:Holliday junction resolvasome RuvABC ATP-dependent DNA helicase subunit